MSMRFRQVSSSIVQNILIPNQNGRFETVSDAKQTIGASEVEGVKRRIQLVYSSGEFPISGGTFAGGSCHEITYDLILYVSARASSDVLVLDDPESSDEERSDAVLETLTASHLANVEMDEFIDIIYQIIMDARNVDMGLDPGLVASRWIESIKKGSPEHKGSLVVLCSVVRLTLSVVENFLGEEGIPLQSIDKTDILNGYEGDNQDTGVSVEYVTAS